MIRYRRTGLSANPFVAFADVAIAMAFIFAMCSLALSKVLSDMTRDERQAKSFSGFLSTMAQSLPNSTSVADDNSRTDYDRKRNVVFKQGADTVGKLQSNASYQRAALTRAYDFGAVWPRDPTAYVGLGNVVREAARGGDISYVFLHPIVQKGELEEIRRQHPEFRDDRDLALARFNAIYQLWLDNGILAAKGQWSESSTKLNPKYVVFYGQEAMYSTSETDQTTKARTPGRVDVLLFYQDASEKDLPTR